MRNLLRVRKGCQCQIVIDWLLVFDEEIYFQSRHQRRRRPEVAVCVQIVSRITRTPRLRNA